MALDGDSTKFLDEVKKGKPRRFAMVMKGEKIVSLVVYKKGSLEKYKKLAKEEGKGQFYHGVIGGKGQNIVFNLCRADGFEAPPGKDIKLKQYLNAEAPEKRSSHVEAAGKLIEEHQAFVKSSPLVQAIEKNPFPKVNVRGRLLETLDELARTLA